MRAVSLCYCLRGDSVLLGMKKRGFGVGKVNGFGGKPKEGETISQAALRELKEEAGITADERDLEKVSELEFFFPDVPKEKSWDQKVHVYLIRTWQGEPKETEEMQPLWCKISELPLYKMWAGDKYWLPAVLNGKKVCGTFHYGTKGEILSAPKITFVENF